MSFDYDLFVIGGGSGGVRAARVAAGEAGAKVALAEEDRYGGTCVIRGCVPKKLMVYASEFPTLMREAASYGWDVTQGALDWTAFRGKLHAELDRLEGIYRNLLKNSGVTSFDAKASLVDAHTVALSTGETVTAKHILIATGGLPTRMEIPGAELAMTSNDIFHMEVLPKTALVIGGGYIASEFAGVLNGLGVKTTQIYRGEQILRGFDHEAVGHVADGMRANGVDLRVNTNITAIVRAGAGYEVTYTDGSKGQFDAVLMATGRAPNVAGLGLENVNITLGNSGEIPVDDYSQTVVPSIFAVGDVTNRANLTPVAIREGMAFVETVFHGNPTEPDHELIPTAIFTQPEMGTVGMSEEEAAALRPIKVFTTGFKPMRQAFAGLEERVFMKLVVCADTDRVLGCHIVAPGAGEMVQLAGIAVKMGATKADFDRTVAVHPTMSEELVTMRNPTRVS